MDVAIPLIVAVLLGSLVVFGATLRIEPEARSRLRNLLLLAFVLRAGLSVVFAVVPSTRLFHEDAGGTEYWSTQLCAFWNHSGPDPRMYGWEVPVRNYGLIYVFAGFNYVFGNYALNITIFNSAIGTINVALVYYIARSLLHEVVAWRAALLVALFPSMIIWSSIALKDPLMSCMICATVLSCIRMRERFTIWNFVFTLLPLVVVYPVRFYLAYFLLASVAGTMAINRSGRVFAGISKQLLLIGGAALLVVAFGLSGTASQDVDSAFNLQSVSMYRHNMAITANSGFAQDVDISTPQKAIVYLPYGLLSLIWSPFPWQMISLRPLMALPEMILWWWMAPALVRGFVEAARHHFSRFAPILVFSGALLIGYSLTMGNVGAAFRMRAQVFNLLFIFASFGRYVALARRRGIDVAMLVKT